MPLRPSTIGAWTLCPKRVEFAEEQRQYPSYAMSRGSLLHARIEHKLDNGYSFSWRGEYDDIVMRDTDEAVSIDDLPAKLVGTLIGEVDAAYATWKNQVFPTIAAYGDDLVVEKTLERELDPGHTVSGTPDLVIPGEKHIIDWKTAGRQWKPAKAVGELQPPAYTWLNGWDTAKFSFVVCDMSNFEWAWHTVYVTPEQTYAWVDLATDVHNAIDAGIYPATPTGQSWTGVRGWHCSPKYCAGWNNCEAKHLIADGQAIEIRNPQGEWK